MRTALITIVFAALLAGCKSQHKNAPPDALIGANSDSARIDAHLDNIEWHAKQLLGQK